MTEEEKIHNEIIDEEHSQKIAQREAKGELIFIGSAGDLDKELREWFTKWWKDNNMTSLKYKKIILDIINKYAEEGEANES